MLAALTNVCLLESGRVVDTVSCDCYDGPLALASLDNDQLLLWRRTSEDDLRVVRQDVVYLRWGHVFQVGAMNDTGLGISEENKITTSTSGRR